MDLESHRQPYNCQELKLCSVLCEFMYFYFDFLFSSVSHFRFPNVYPLHLLSIMFSEFKPCPSFLSCQIVLVSCLVLLLSVFLSLPIKILDQVLPLDILSRPVILYLCLLDSFSGLTSLPVTGLVCLWTLYFCLELSIKLVFAILRESVFGSLPACDNNKERLGLRSA